MQYNTKLVERGYGEAGPNVGSYISSLAKAGWTLHSINVVNIDCAIVVMEKPDGTSD